MRRRLVLAIAGVATAAVVLFAVPLGLVLGDAHRTSDLLRLQRDTFAATRQIDLSQSPRDAVELPSSSDQLAVYDRAGRRVAGHGPATAPAVVLRALSTARPADAPGGGALVVAVPLLSGERVTGAVRALRPEGQASGQTNGERLGLAGIAVAIVLVSVLAALWLGRVLARPLEQLVPAASRLGHGDFSIRAPRAGIPEVDGVAEALDTTARRLEELIARERSFSADASHQLRTPLQALRIELEAAELRGGAPPEVQTALAQVERLEATIATLLAVARDVPRHERTTALRPVLEEAAARWHSVLAAMSRPLRVTAADSQLAAASDPRVVQQVLDVLLDNAASHGAGAVHVGVREVEDWVAIDVGDEGTGFGAEPESAFARREGAENGHGIGLALARALAHAEGGRLTITQPGRHPVVTFFVRRDQGRLNETS
jgi:signal transduction histidine kinase